MNYRKAALLLCFFFFVQGCKKKECEETNNQAYGYPIEAARGKPSEERIEMFKIPEQILHCLSTDALVKSCLNYPEFGLIWAYNSFQQGFDQVNSRCNGFNELWERSDKFQALFSLYKQKNIDRVNWNSYTILENGNYLFDIICVELILSQYKILQDLSVSEKKELFQLALDNQKKKVELIQYWGRAGMQTNIAILGRIMYLDNYGPLVQEYTNNEMVFIGIDRILILDSDVVNIVMSLSEDYLKILKSKQK